MEKTIPIYEVLRRISSYDCWGKTESSYVSIGLFYEDKEEAERNKKDGKVAVRRLIIKEDKDE